jgi:hypothetical protein
MYAVVTFNIYSLLYFANCLYVSNKSLHDVFGEIMQKGNLWVAVVERQMKIAASGRKCWGFDGYFYINI